MSAVDEIRFEPAGTGTRIDYTADIRLGGLLRLVQPFLGGAFAARSRATRSRGWSGPSDASPSPTAGAAGADGRRRRCGGRRR